jgi:hypothetical protein
MQPPSGSRGGLMVRRGDNLAAAETPGMSNTLAAVTVVRVLKIRRSMLILLVVGGEA